MQVKGIRQDRQVLPLSQGANMMPKRLTKVMRSSTGDIQRRRTIQAGQANVQMLSQNPHQYS